MKFTRHVFISYAHIDNEPLTPDERGWVSLFHLTLQTMLTQRLGLRAEIWRDEKLRGNDVFSDEILDQFPRTALLISILTPRYLNSEWCTREIREFCRVAQGNLGLVVENKARVFKVIKSPLPGEENLPAVVSEVLGYDFYEFDEDQTPRELDPAYGDRARSEFLRKTNKLAWDIAQLIKRMEAAAEATPAVSAAAATAAAGGAELPVIYLAETSRDRRQAREVLETELRRLGYRVLPEQKLPTDESDYVEAVRALLAQAKLSVHLIGSGYGLVPDGPSQRSVVVLQNALAVERARSHALQRVVWLPSGTEGEQPAQQAFIRSMHEDGETQFGADVVGGDLENLKSAVHAASARLRERRLAAPPAAAAAAPLVYILCSEQDRRDTLPLFKYLKARGLDPKLPVFSGDAAAVRAANDNLLASADAVLLYYGSGDEAWKFHQQNEIRKAAAIERARPLRGVFTLVAAPPNDDKEFLIALGEADTLDALQGYSDAALAPLAALFAAPGQA
ncbi:MAG: toll/interleukin-1 receptor domain-containing protein [Rhodocyclaceae bacterium]|nr:toll/interleukin-1 receptor domain-containing protein [Rhodocyclaceae bacterium]MBX3668866.1 toll/interleukin-1 receptor domain-containing protein [Rhodocyclaceae bacterium]